MFADEQGTSAGKTLLVTGVLLNCARTRVACSLILIILFREEGYNSCFLLLALFPRYSLDLRLKSAIETCD